MKGPCASYRCYCYGRLSKEDGDKPESDSIKMQRQLLHDFIARHPDLELTQEGYDDGYTGTNFRRPHFRQMLEAIRQGTVNCVVVKDLSRFGREYIEAGQYLEKLFPAFGVRFIAVADGYDSLYSTVSDGLMIPFKNLINDAYCRDTSVKIRSHLDIKRQTGQFIGAFAPYGYRKDPQDKNHLLPDEEAASVVRRIFSWYIGGAGKSAIAQKLNALGVPNPSAYKRQQGLQYCNPSSVCGSSLWTAGSVAYILSNPVYLGTMVQGRQRILSYKLPKAVQVPKEQWFTVENTHQPLVSQAVFDRAQSQKATRQAVFSTAESRPLLSGLLRCAVCGKPMAHHRAKGYRYYRCRPDRQAQAHHCAIRAEAPEETVVQVLQVLFSLQKPWKAACSQAAPAARQQLEALQRQARHLRFLADSLYPDWKDGHLDAEEYTRLKGSYRSQIDALEAKITAIQSAAQPEAQAADFVRLLPDAETRLRELLSRLVARVLVHRETALTIVLRFSDPFFQGAPH